MRTRSFFLYLFFLANVSCISSDKSRQSVGSQKARGRPGQSLPGNWRAFSDDSPWNTPIPTGAVSHRMSDAIMARMSAAFENIRLGNSYLIPLWVVDADNMDLHRAEAAYPFDIWDVDNNLITDIGVPIDTTLWGEQTTDGHIILIDTVYDLSWEMSRFKGIQDGLIKCSTFNVWDLSGKGVGDPDEGRRWKARGGRGSGFPNIAGLVRPEEIMAGKIGHALAFTFPTNRKDEFYYPAVRSDGRFDVADAPSEGMLFQLNPDLTQEDFDTWGLSESASTVARALQEYGMYLCDNGGGIALQVQLLDRDPEEHRKKWDAMAPGLYATLTGIPTKEFRVIDTGAPRWGGHADRVTTPLIAPGWGAFEDTVEVSIVVNDHWPGATIRYTLDGSTPTDSSTLYEGPFKLTSSHTVNARAFHPDGRESHVMRATLRITNERK